MNTPRSSSYPTLTSMGIESPKQIDKYYITSMSQTDVLRVVYQRPEGSFLPSTRSYKFPRIFEKTAESTGDGVPRTHPTLRKALDELDKVLKAKASNENIVAEILSEIELLEEDIAFRSECLKVLVTRIPAID